MNRKQIINVLLSLSMVFMAVMPMNGVIALAAEAAEGATAGITASADPEEIGKAPETVAEEIMSDDTAGPEESQAADTSDDMRTDSAETAMTVEEEDAAEEDQRDAMEYGSDDTSGSNDYDFPVIVITDPVPPGGHITDPSGIRKSHDDQCRLRTQGEMGTCLRCERVRCLQREHADQEDIEDGDHGYRSQVRQRKEIHA